MFLKALNASEFCFNIETQSILVQSSTNMRKYLLPPRVYREKGPHRSPWITSNAFETQSSVAKDGNGALVCFEMIQLEQRSSLLCIVGRTLTMY